MTNSFVTGSLRAPDEERIGGKVCGHIRMEKKHQTAPKYK